MHHFEWITGYCTNVHAGTDLESLKANLAEFAAPVQQRAHAHSAMGVGLWVPHEAAFELLHHPGSVESLRETLDAHHLAPYTFNGFPFGNFHQEVVKHQVYHPAWWERERLDYTMHLVTILSQLLPPGLIGSISTLPLGWGQISEDEVRGAAENLHAMADVLSHHESDTGQRIVLAIEPEPGCAIDTSAGMVEFFDRHLQGAHHRRYLTVCHDVCHAAVMFESQSEVLARYAQHEITVGKIQISSAIEVPWSQMDPGEHEAARAQLSAFAEDRYLHQTGRLDREGHFTLADDLPMLLSQPHDPEDQTWRIHFHVPIFLDAFGALRATQAQILECLRAITATPTELKVNHLEVETYAWGVLPEAMRERGLSDSIAEEMIWLDSTLKSMAIPATSPSPKIKQRVRSQEFEP